MNNLYLFNAKHIETIKGTAIEKQSAIVFFHSQYFDFDDFSKRLDSYFEKHSIPEKIILLVPKYLEIEFDEIIQQRSEDLCRVIPTNHDRRDIFNFVLPFYYDSDGDLMNSHLINVAYDKTLISQMLNNALVDIFQKRDGLIKSEDAHHFVFPSGKHCNYFLRPGNILVKGNEIFFIAFNLLSKLKVDDTMIYCDTSSINSVAFALIELKRRLNKNYIIPYVESFGSYSAFENNDFKFKKNSFFLISSSTSSRIIDRLLEKKVDLDQIALIFCMGRKKAYKKNIICDLLFDKKINPGGINVFASYELVSECVLCKSGSIPVEVTGDVFQIEKPKINLLELKVTDAPKFHMEFVKAFFCRKNHDFNVIKSHYYEAINKDELANPSYETFLDISGLMNNISKFTSFKEKLDNYITQYIPSKTKFIMHLPDNGSRLIAEYIKRSISSSIKNPDDIILINQNDLFKNETLTDYKDKSSAIIVCSSLVSGSRLLYVSREMRDFSNLSLIYFIGISRTEDERHLTFIKNNLTMGKYGINTNLFIEIERIYTPNERQNTPWVVESNFLVYIKNFCESQDPVLYEKAIIFFEERIELLDNGYKSNGITENLFLPNILTNQELKINKNFAFYKFDGYKDNASQSDVYFTIAVIMNSLRNSSDLNRKITNSHFVRTLLEPNNFNRYNDGIIQAAILRSAHSKELNYSLDKKSSFAMLNIIIGIIEFSNQNHGDALLEFLYAIAVKKLRLKDYHVNELFEKLETNRDCKSNVIIQAFINYCKKVTFGTNKEMVDDYSIKLDFD